MTLRFLGFLGNHPDWNACQKTARKRDEKKEEGRKREREAAAGETRSGGRKSQTSNRQFRPPYEHAACLNKNQPDLRSTSTLVSRDCTDALPCYRALEYERNFHNCTSIFLFSLFSFFSFFFTLLK